ncbi:histone H2B domain-containing protein [Heterostelium album PN500]|uniref:Histone H2B domain-containing protein n=1 Tax=Heterostelium pallidum (strain ATCC 26659 / Pp 5 / PN500) TaxID=670386 RepID=D3BM33_HETP5|nr:histone H2B domain-containing protein [Heterostelium album PN500]EFA77634.1 histone H2B domain-containing protein [Heterostelium album PN500]|eukprot:XP_020429762.1 histone H2B domain-containing protein [Heterostelium album PN500]
MAPPKKTAAAAPTPAGEKAPKVPKAAKTPAAEGEKKKKKKKADYTSFSIYIHKLLKQIVPTNPPSGDAHKKITISSKAMNVMNSFVHDIFERIATEAGILARKKKRSTLHSRDIQVAVRITLTGELAKHAIVQGMTAVHKYNPNSEAPKN